MGQEDSSKKGRGGKHFTYEQRVRIRAFLSERFSRVVFLGMTLS